MTKRTLTITMTPDWSAALRVAGKRARSRGYQGEVLNFESAGSFFGKLTERRLELVHSLQGQGPMPVRELARRVARDVRRVQDDVEVLAEVGLVERTDSGGVECPFAAVHINMRLTAHQPLPLAQGQTLQVVVSGACFQ
jgi:predicted transcriptional regulator